MLFVKRHFLVALSIFLYSGNEHISLPLTATTITFSFVGPQNFGGRPLKAYAAQIKKSAQPWEYAFNKTWPAGMS